MRRPTSLLSPKVRRSGNARTLTVIGFGVFILEEMDSFLVITGGSLEWWTCHRSMRKFDNFIPHYSFVATIWAFRGKCMAEFHTLNNIRCSVILLSILRNMVDHTSKQLPTPNRERSHRTLCPHWPVSYYLWCSNSRQSSLDSSRDAVKIPATETSGKSWYQGAKSRACPEPLRISF